MLKVQISEVNEDGLPVLLPSGVEWKVLTNGEVEYVNERVRLYDDQYKFSNVSDKQDVDRVIIMETLSHRWGLWLSLGKDYWNGPFNEQNIRKSLADYSSEIRQLKKSMGIDKATRERDKGEDSISAYLESLRIRAQEFGISRNKMMDKGIELSQQLIALWVLYDNCDELERLEQKCTAQDLVDFIGEVFKPQFQAVDGQFRETSQRYWITKQ